VELERISIPPSSSSEVPTVAEMVSAASSESGAVKAPSPATPQKVRCRRTKEQLKEELREKKVMEKKRELRRQRTLNRKYLSEDFTSIFSENRELLSSSGYVPEEEEDEEAGEGLQPDTGGNYSPGMDLTDDIAMVTEETHETVVEETVVEDSILLSEMQEAEEEAATNVGDMENRPSPYSNISEDSESVDSVILVDVQPGHRERREDRENPRKRRRNSSDDGEKAEQKCDDRRRHSRSGSRSRNSETNNDRLDVSVCLSVSVCPCSLLCVCIMRRFMYCLPMGRHTRWSNL